MEEDFTTYENVETIPLTVIKKNLNREQYDRNKLINGVRRACYKRPIASDKLEAMIDAIEGDIFNAEDKEISSTKIGEIVMSHLKDLDSVAYVRFASVYREFKDVSTFMAVSYTHLDVYKRQALMNGDPVQISMHSNLIYSAFDPRFNVVSLPFIYDSVEDADAKFDGEAGEKMKEILSEYGLHCMGIAENGFRELTNSVREVKSVDDMKNLKVRVAGSNLLMECYRCV